jgi:hypothetical protein
MYSYITEAILSKRSDEKPTDSANLGVDYVLFAVDFHAIKVHKHNVAKIIFITDLYM